MEKVIMHWYDWLLLYLVVAPLSFMCVVLQPKLAPNKPSRQNIDIRSKPNQ
jgi:hypothetical protein